MLERLAILSTPKKEVVSARGASDVLRPVNRMENVTSWYLEGDSYPSILGIFFPSS
jgi:hypothetical protein